MKAIRICLVSILIAAFMASAAHAGFHEGRMDETQKSFKNGKKSIEKGVEDLTRPATKIARSRTRSILIAARREPTKKDELRDIKRCDRRANNLNRRRVRKGRKPIPSCSDQIQTGTWPTAESTAQKFKISAIAKRKFTLPQCKDCKLQLVFYCNENVSKPSDLRGKKVGTPFRTPSLVAQKWGARRFPQFPYFAAENGLRQGIIDCAAIQELRSNLSMSAPTHATAQNVGAQPPKQAQTTSNHPIPGTALLSVGNGKPSEGLAICFHRSSRKKIWKSSLDGSKISVSKGGKKDLETFLAANNVRKALTSGINWRYAFGDLQRGGIDGISFFDRGVGLSGGEGSPGEFGKLLGLDKIPAHCIIAVRTPVCPSKFKGAKGFVRCNSKAAQATPKSPPAP